MKLTRYRKTFPTKKINKAKAKTNLMGKPKNIRHLLCIKSINCRYKDLNFVRQIVRGNIIVFKEAFFFIKKTCDKLQVSIEKRKTIIIMSEENIISSIFFSPKNVSLKLANYIKYHVQL